ncbi:MAG TPA: flagellar biosynthetic protein FliO [Gammaproteobacteria bacterium]|nr:flagellar biosynthetic protein FliO [Gammaproteobacteria bacterium]
MQPSVSRVLLPNCVAMLFSGIAAAATQPGDAPAGHDVAGSLAQDPLAMNSLWQLTAGMLLVLGLILAIAWLLKRSGRFQAGAGGGMRILGGLSMGTRERVVLVQVGETQLLLGVAPGRVQTLHVLEQPLDAGNAMPPAAGGFADQLGRLLKKEKTS